MLTLCRMVALILLCIVIVGCSATVVNLYQGEERPKNQLAFIRGGPKVFIMQMDSVIVNEPTGNRNSDCMFSYDLKFRSGKWYAILPGSHVIKAQYRGLYTHINPSFTYYKITEIGMDGPHWKVGQSKVSVAMISDSIKSITYDFEAGKKYELTANIGVNLMSEFRNPGLPDIIAPELRDIVVCDPSGQPAPPATSLSITGFPWNLNLHVLGETTNYPKGDSKIFEAVDSGNTDFASFLIAAGETTLNTSGGNTTTLHLAASKGQVSLVSMLISYDADINAASESGMTPLHLASENGHYEIVKLLINYGADIDAKNKMNATPLFYAAGNGHTEVVGFLIKSGANVNICQKNKWTPLHHAVHGGHIEAVRLLLDHGAKIYDKTDIDLTPLMIAVNEEHADIVKLLLEYGAETKYRDENGWTALHYAAKTGDTSIIRLLVKGGAMIDAVSETDCTPLHNAALAGKYDAAEMLLGYGANVNAVSRGGFTPLHMAAVDGDAKLGQLLINFGADTSAKMNNGQTPRDIAIEKSHVLFIGLLQNAE